MHSTAAASKVSFRSRENTSAMLELQAFFFHGTLFYLKKTTNKLQTMITQASEFGRYFLKNKQSEPVTCRRTNNGMRCQ